MSFKSDWHAFATGQLVGAAMHIAKVDIKRDEEDNYHNYFFIYPTKGVTLLVTVEQVNLEEETSKKQR